MSDALCGPSNPLQQFKQHSQLDRTLQQDRLTSRYSPAQGFRSHNPNAGLLDPEFEAFQASVPPSDLPQFQPYHPPPAQLGGPSQAPSWATDFQHMQISSPPTLQQQYAPQAGPASVNWAEGFREHMAQSAPRAQNCSPSPQAFQYRARYGMTGFRSDFAQPSRAAPVQSKGKEAAVEHFDEAAFERAFDQARDDMMVDVEPMESEKLPDMAVTAAEQEISVDQSSHEAMAAINAGQRPLSGEGIVSTDPEALALAERIDNLANGRMEQMQERAIQQEEEQGPQQQEDDDALAATAHELLEKVEHNKTEKFRNSQFLSLMRKLRDREVKIEGDKMVETAAPSTANEPLNASSTIPPFDNSEQRPSPFPQAVDTRPPNYDIPPQEQDLDVGRIDPRDGQAVVDHLNQRTSAADPDEIAAASSYDPEPAENYADAPSRGWEPAGAYSKSS